MLSSLTPTQFRIIVVLLIVLAGVLVALIGVQIFGSTDGDPVGAGTTAATTTTLPPTATTPATTAAPTTTVPETTTSSTTTSSSTTSSTTSSSTTTSSTTSTTTTTVPAPPPLVLADDGLGVVSFGAGVTDTIAAVTAALGFEPDADTGWLDPFDNPYGTCPPPEVRGVEWGILVVLFTSFGTDFAPEGTRHFFSYMYAPQPGKPDAGPAGLTTAEGIGLASTVGDLEGAYGARLELFDFDIGSFWAVDLDFEVDTALGGLLTGTDPSDEVVSVLGGTGCGE